MDIATAEEEIARWKGAAEQEAAAGGAVEQELSMQVCSPLPCVGSLQFSSNRWEKRD